MRGLERDLALLKVLETDVWIIARLHEGLHKADAIMRRCKQAMEETQLLLNSVDLMRGQGSPPPANKADSAPTNPRPDLGRQKTPSAR